MYTADIYVKKSKRQARNAAARFDREAKEYRDEQKRQERDCAAAFKAQMAPLRNEARAIVDSDEARPWLQALAKKSNMSLTEARSFMRSKCVSDPNVVLKWAAEKRLADV